MWTEETFALVREGIYAAKECRTNHLSKEWVRELKKRKNYMKSVMEKSSLNIVIFHIKIPDHASKIDTPDIKGGDHNAVDYERLLDLNVKIAKWLQPNANIIVLTDKVFAKDLKNDASLKVIRLDVKGEEPMFERVVAMNAYVRSSLFTAPTVFLDIDAFMLRPLDKLFDNDFDIGLTHRHIVGQMAINEGVIFANNKNYNKVVKFFDSYLACYLEVEKSQRVRKIYKNIRRWRGGQLAINAAAGGCQVYSTSLSSTEYDAKIAFLPCSKYNLSQINEEEVNKDLRNRCSVLHLKGNRKGWIERLVNSLSFYGFEL